jgi:hypothetical protein
MVGRPGGDGGRGRCRHCRWLGLVAGRAAGEYAGLAGDDSPGGGPAATGDTAKGVCLALLSGVADRRRLAGAAGRSGRPLLSSHGCCLMLRCRRPPLPGLSGCCSAPACGGLPVLLLLPAAGAGAGEDASAGGSAAAATGSLRVRPTASCCICCSAAPSCACQAPAVALDRERRWRCCCCCRAGSPGHTSAAVAAASLLSAARAGGKAGGMAPSSAASLASKVEAGLARASWRRRILLQGAHHWPRRRHRNRRRSYRQACKRQSGVAQHVPVCPPRLCSALPARPRRWGSARGDGCRR